MVHLDLKKLSKGMHIQDKMKLLFQDINRQAETAGKESILTPQERDAILDDARKSGEMKEIRRVNELYRTTMFLDIDIEIAERNLLLAICQLEKTLMGVILKGATEDLISEIFYDMANQNNKSPATVETSVSELRKKYKIDSVILKGFDLFNPPMDEEETEQTEEQSANTSGLEPNRGIQKSFMFSFQIAKKLKSKLYEMSYVTEKASIDFLPASIKQLIKNSEELIAMFCNLDESLRLLRVYRDYAADFTNDATLVEPKFLETIQDIQTHLELNTEEKDALEKKIDESLKDDLY